MTEIRNDHFKFSTAILSRLGEELNPHPHQGIIELVRNSYDADALNCKIELSGVSKKGGAIRITDDGTGMDLPGISNGWLVLGRSGKSRRKRTKKYKRRPVGDKGLGRLAALRMGRRVTLITRPQEEPLFEHKVIIDWGNYDRVNVIEDVILDIETNATTKSGRFGTEILIENLYSSLRKKELGRLARSLLLLTDPFGNPSGFKPTLDAKEFDDLERILQNEYFPSAEYHLKAKINNKGMASATITDWHGRKLWTAEHFTLKKKDKPYDVPKATFEFWAFNLGKTEFLPSSISLTDIRAWLAAVGGVHFYHRGLRVYPYGDKGHDWLELNLRRVQNPELRPSTNTSIGRLCIDDPNNKLIQKTDRTGFIENNTFEELSAFAHDVLEWMASSRLKMREEKRLKKRSTAKQNYQKTRKALDNAIKEIPEEFQETIKEIVSTFEDASTKHVEVLKEEVQLYRTLGTVGTTFAVFSHEVKKPMRRIHDMANAIENTCREMFAEKYDGILEESVKMIRRSVEAMIALPEVALKLLERDKRETKVVSVNREITNVLQMFAPFFKQRGVNPEKELVDINPYIYGSEAAIQSILTNLINNSLNAFTVEAGQNKTRKIIFRTLLSKQTVQIHVLDSGPGICNLSINEIWLPGKTTTQNGTGLGLTIVRDAVADLEGKAYAIAKSELGGAEIVIELPITKERP